MRKGSTFIAHASDVPSQIKKPLSQFELKKMLANECGNFMLFNNVCPHQGSLILSNKSESMACQYHGWAWDASNGNPISSGHSKLCNSVKIKPQSTFLTNDILFTNTVDLNAVSHIDLSYMELKTERVDVVNCNFKNVIDVFLDVDHIPIVHKGVYDKMGLRGDTQVEWLFYSWGNLQLISRNSQLDSTYENTLLAIKEETLAAFWLTVYPYTMIEWQPGALFVTVCSPEADNTNVSVFKYKDSRYSNENWELNSKTWETAWQQDRHQAAAIVNRCNHLPHLEQSKIHFRNWLAK